jgi:quercetin dioxygenase-like cupin family protein
MPKEDIAMDGASARPALERDPVKIDPNHYKVELENDKVRVVRIRYGPHEKSPMHQHPPGVAVFLTDAECEFIYPDGKKENIQAKAGEFQSFAEAWEHEPRNLSANPLEVLYVELKT